MHTRSHTIFLNPAIELEVGW